MRAIPFFTIALGLAASIGMSGAALAQQRTQEVSFQVAGQKVVGTLELPAGAAATSAAPPVVLMLHGFTGSGSGIRGRVAGLVGSGLRFGRLLLRFGRLVLARAQREGQAHSQRQSGLLHHVHAQLLGVMGTAGTHCTLP